MKQLIIPAAVAAAALSACGAATDAPAQKDAPRTLSVSGVGEASGAPDLAVLSIGVEAEAATAAAALAQNAAQMNATISKLKSAGVADKDMQTLNLSISPRYNYEENRAAPKILGYVATNMLSVKLRNLETAGAIIDETVAEGANSLGGLSFGFADPKPLMNTAREDAVADAKARAELIAKAAGVTLGPILMIQDGYAAPPPTPYMDTRMMAAESKSTPISAGESTFSATVSIIYEIR
ncbi:MAG: SIMPL domain-containing protein [Parvularculaceae bacterium]